MIFSVVLCGVAWCVVARVVLCVFGLVGVRVSVLGVGVWALGLGLVCFV